MVLGLERGLMKIQILSADVFLLEPFHLMAQRIWILRFCGVLRLKALMEVRNTRHQESTHEDGVFALAKIAELRFQ